MYIEIDLAAVPPAATLQEPDDFKGFALQVKRPEHAWVPVEELRRLAGERAGDPQWKSELEGMLAYAESKGWTRADGAVRAHIEWE